MTTPRPAGNQDPRASRPRSGPRRLPATQPRRACTVIGGYLATVAVIAGALFLIGNGPTVPLLSAGFALLLLVPLAVLLPVPRPESALDPDRGPVLKRAKPPAQPGESA